MSRILNIQAAVLEILNQNSNLQAYKVLAYGFLPLETTKPFIKINELTNTKETDFKERLSICLGIYSDYKGTKEIIELCKIVEECLILTAFNKNLFLLGFTHKTTSIYAEEGGFFYAEIKFDAVYES